MENRTFDKFVKLLGDYLENTHLDTVEEGAAERVGQSVFLRSPDPLDSLLGLHFPSPQVRGWPAGRGYRAAARDGAGRSSHSSKRRGCVRRAAGNVRPLKALAGSFVPQTGPPGRGAWGRGPGGEGRGAAGGGRRAGQARAVRVRSAHPGRG